MHLIEEVLLWLDADPARFWTAAWGTYGVVVLAAFFPPGKTAPPGWRRGNALLFGAGVCLVLAAFRWPVWYYPRDLNPDEAQIVAGAITLDQFPVYWKYVDGTTHGPGCEYFLVLAHGLGAPLNYFTARVIATLLQAGSIIAVWGTLRCFTTERAARVAALPALTFWGLVTWDDFVHYSTELPGLFFLAVAGWLMAVILRAPVLRRRHLAVAGLAGLCLGAVPFSKLQSTPQGIVLALLMLLVLWRGRTDLPPGGRARIGAVFVAGGLAPALLVAGLLSIYGLWNHFYASYILSALDYLNYSEHRPVLMPIRFFNFSATEPAFAWFFWGSLAFSLIYVRAATTEKPLRIGLVAAWILVGVAYYSVLRPAREVVHYLHLLVIPLTTLAGFSLAVAAGEAGSAGRVPGPRAAVPWLLLILLILSPQVYQRVLSWDRFVGYVREYRVEPVSEAARFIRDRAQPGDTVAMWGWEPSLLVETGLPHGTREAQTVNQMIDWPIRPYYLTRYLWDMERRAPAWFVDVVGPGSFAFEDRATRAHEAVSALRDFIAAHYEFQAEFQNRRIYRRKAGGQP